MHATAACDHSGVVLLGRCCTSLDCCLFAPTVLATSRYGLLLAYTGEAGRFYDNIDMLSQYYRDLNAIFCHIIFIVKIKMVK